MLVSVRRTGAIQFIKVLLLYGTPTNGVYSSSMAAKKKDVKAKENQARRPVAAKTSSAPKKDKGLSIGSVAKGVGKFVAKTSGPVIVANLVRGKYNADIKKEAKSVAGTLGRYSTPAMAVRLATGKSVLTNSKVRSEYKKNVLKDLGNVASVTGVGKAAPGAAKAVKSTGAPAKLANIVTGKKVVVHGSPTKNIKSIKPTSGSPGAPTETVGWGFNPAKKGAKTAIANNAQGYSQGSGSLYVAKAGKRATKFAEGSGKAITKSTKPMKVVKEIQVAGKSQTQIQKELKDALKKAGSPAKGVGVKGKVKQVKAKSQTKKANKNSVV